MTMKMQYKEITNCLKDLIEVHDFVIIPEFGAFVMQLESAEFSISENVLFPPRKKVLFNPTLKHNDGLLVSELQKKLGIEFALAQIMVERFVQTIHLLLDTKRRVDIEEIGYFYKDIEGNILFENTLDPFYLSESFGLSPVHAIPVEAKPVFQSTSSVKHTATEKIINIDRKNIYKAAAVILISIMLLAYWYIAPFDIKTNFANIIGTKPLNKIKINSSEYPVFKIKYNELVLKEQSLSFHNTLSNAVFSENNSTSVFSIVAGCFRVEQNAKRLVLNLSNKNIKAGIKWNSEKQLFVVSVGHFQNKSEAIKMLSGLKNKGILKDAWVKEE